MARRPPRIQADLHASEIAAIYRDAQRRLEALITEALERRAAGTAAYRQAQLEAVRRELARAGQAARPAAARAIAIAYSVGARAADQALGNPAIRFSGVHRDAISVLADNLVTKLGQAEANIGRRTADAFRTASLRETAAGIATGSARREVSDQLEQRIVREGITDALTGFVDKGGRRWPLDTYTEMVARTTTREAVSWGTATRLREAGDDLVTITEHADACTLCLDYEGQTYSLSGDTEGYDVLDQLPPFHPNCRHVLTPAAANFEAFETSLGLAGGE